MLEWSSIDIIIVENLNKGSRIKAFMRCGNEKDGPLCLTSSSTTLSHTYLCIFLLLYQYYFIVIIIPDII